MKTLPFDRQLKSLVGPSIHDAAWADHDLGQISGNGDPRQRPCEGLFVDVLVGELSEA